MDQPYDEYKGIDGSPNKLGSLVETTEDENIPTSHRQALYNTNPDSSRPAQNSARGSALGRNSS